MQVRYQAALRPDFGNCFMNCYAESEASLAEARKMRDAARKLLRQGGGLFEQEDTGAAPGKRTRGMVLRA